MKRKMGSRCGVFVLLTIAFAIPVSPERLRGRSRGNPGPPDARGCCNPKGCTDKLAVNFDSEAIEDDGTCVFAKPPPKTMNNEETQYQYYHSEMDPDQTGIFESTYTRAVRRVRGRMREDASLDPLSQGDPYDGAAGIGSVEGEVMKPPVTTVTGDDGTEFGGYSDMWPRPINVAPVEAVPVGPNEFQMNGG